MLLVLLAIHAALYFLCDTYRCMHTHTYYCNAEVSVGVRSIDFKRPFTIVDSFFFYIVDLSSLFSDGAHARLSMAIDQTAQPPTSCRQQEGMAEQKRDTQH